MNYIHTYYIFTFYNGVLLTGGAHINGSGADGFVGGTQRTASGAKMIASARSRPTSASLVHNDAPHIIDYRVLWYVL